MTADLRIYRFDATADYAGEIAGAVERMDLALGPRVCDALFVMRDADSGDVVAIDLASGRADGSFAALLDFRLDRGRRRAATARTLADHPGGVPPAVVAGIGEHLAPGSAQLAVLVAGGAPRALDEAVLRCGGRLAAHEEVEGSALGEVADRLTP